MSWRLFHVTATSHRPRLTRSLRTLTHPPPPPPPYLAHLIAHHAHYTPQLFPDYRQLGQSPSLALLEAANITRDEYELWCPAVQSHSISDTLRALSDNGVNIPSTDLMLARLGNVHKSLPQFPTWLLIFILCHKVSSPEDTLAALRLLRYHYPAARSLSRVPLLTLTTAHLAKHSFIAGVAPTVDDFLKVNHEHSSPHFNVLLMTLACGGHSQELANNALQIIRVMAKRYVHLSAPAIDLLSDLHFLTPPLAAALLERIEKQRSVPKTTWLKNFSVVFARRGWRQRTRYCLDLMVGLHDTDYRDETSASKEWSPKDMDTVQGSAELVSVDADSSQGSKNATLDIKLSPSHRDRGWRSRQTASRLSILQRPGFKSVLQRVRLHRSLVRPSDRVYHRTQYHISFARVAYMNSLRDLRCLQSHVTKTQRSVVDGHTFSKSVKASKTWCAMVRLLTRKRVPADTIIQTVRRAQLHHPSLRSDSALYCAALLGLVKRREFEKAEALWDEYYASKSEHNLRALAVGAKVLTMADRPLDALGLYIQYITRHDSRRIPRPLDVRAVNGYMIALLRSQRPDAVFALWDNMEPLLGVLPNSYTLAILLKAARFARKYEPIMHQIKEEIGLNSLLRNTGDNTGPHKSAPTPQQALDTLGSVLSKDLTREEVGLWNGARAGPLALHLTQRIFYTNWPSIVTVRSPCRAVRPTSDFPALHPLRALLNSFMHRSPDSENSEAVVEESGDALAFRRILPNDVVFRAYIDLLAEEGLSPEIPRALAWMRRMRVEPSRDTLATALIYWGEVAAEAPLVEYWNGGAEKSQYQALIDWLKKWVANERLPRRRQMARNLQRIRWLREKQWVQEVWEDQAREDQEQEDQEQKQEREDLMDYMDGLEDVVVGEQPQPDESHTEYVHVLKK